MCALYGKVEYWNARYQKMDKLKTTEWYRSYQQFSYLLTPSILSAEIDDSVLNDNRIPVKECSFQLSSPTISASTHRCFPDRAKARVLIVGCGNSSLPFDMVLDGWTGGVVAVDFSSSVIQHMQDKISSSRYATTHGRDLSKLLEFVCADVTMPLPGYVPGSFDLIVCKGTLDAILCSQGSHAKAKCFIRNCVTLLSPQNGVLALITTGNPDSRFEYLEHRNTLSYFWRHVSVYPVRKAVMSNSIEEAREQPPVVFCYICRKRPDPDHDDVNKVIIGPFGEEIGQALDSTQSDFIEYQ